MTKTNKKLFQSDTNRASIAQKREITGYLHIIYMAVLNMLLSALVFTGQCGDNTTSQLTVKNQMFSFNSLW